MRNVAQFYERHSRFARWSVRIAAFAAALTLAGLVLHRLFNMPTPFALNTFAVGFGLAALAVILSLGAMVFIWRTGASGISSALGGLAIALAVLGWPAAYIPTILVQAPLNDVTTDFENPPSLAEAENLRPPGNLPTAYPGLAAKRVQEELFADIRPLVVERPAGETLDLVREALRRQGMTIVAEREIGPDQVGAIQAVATTPIIGFRDDVAIRVTGRAGMSRIDVRSASRWGRYDFGRNADRVRRIVRAILDRLQSTVPGAVATR